MARQTRRSLAQSILLTFERDVLPQGYLRPSSATKENRYSYLYNNGSEIVLGGLDDPQKFLSSEYDIIYIAQAEEILGETISTLKTRLSNFKLPFQQLLMDANPRSPTHWLKKRCDAGLTTYIPARWCDNPKYCEGSGQLPPPGVSEYWTGLDWTELGIRFLEDGGWTKEGIQYLAGQWNTAGHAFERLILGKWSHPEGARFKGASRFVQGFTMEQQFPHGIPVDWPRWLSGDYGKADPYCALWHTRAPDGTIYSYQEDYEPGYEADEQAERIVANSPANDHRYESMHLDASMFQKGEAAYGFGARVVGPNRKKVAASDFYGEIFRAENERLRALYPERDFDKFGPLVKGARNKNEEAYVTLDVYLRTGRWRVCVDCVNLWNEIEDAVYYKDPRTGIPSELINPGNKKYCADHALEAAGYGIHKRVPTNRNSGGTVIDYEQINRARMQELRERQERSSRGRPNWAR